MGGKGYSKWRLPQRSIDKDESVPVKSIDHEAFDNIDRDKLESGPYEYRQAFAEKGRHPRCAREKALPVLKQVFSRQGER